MSPKASFSRMLAALAPALAPGQDRDADAGGGGERRDGVEVLPRQDLGRRHQRGLPPAFDHGRGREQRHHGLARPTSPCSSRSMRSGLARSATMSATARVCETVSE